MKSIFDGIGLVALGIVLMIYYPYEALGIPIVFSLSKGLHLVCENYKLKKQYG